MADRYKGLTGLQRLFVQEYLVDMNATAAAKRAGYAPASAMFQGGKLVRSPKIRAAIDEAQRERTKRTQIDQDWVVLRLREVTDRCMQHEPVRDRKGNPTGEYVFDSSGATRALELLGKNLGMFKERHEHTGKDGGPIQTEDVNAVRDEFARRIAGIAARSGTTEGNITTH